MLVVNLGSLAPRYAARARLIPYRVQLGRLLLFFSPAAWAWKLSCESCKGRWLVLSDVTT